MLQVQKLRTELGMGGQKTRRMDGLGMRRYSEALRTENDRLRSSDSEEMKFACQVSEEMSS